MIIYLRHNINESYITTIKHSLHLKCYEFRYKFGIRCCEVNPMIYVHTLHKSRDIKMFQITFNYTNT